MSKILLFLIWIAFFLIAVPADAQSYKRKGKKTTNPITARSLAQGSVDTFLLQPALGLGQKKEKTTGAQKSRFSDVVFYSSEEVIWGFSTLKSWGTKDHWVLGPGLQITDEMLEQFS